MSNNFYTLLGKKIFCLRKSQKLSREKFAEIAGINDYYLGEIERGEKKSFDRHFTQNFQNIEYKNS